jgi:hypothetical protein
MLKRAVVFLALLCFPALASAQTPNPPTNAVVTYYAGNPFGGCSKGRLWWNTTSNVLWVCETGTWVSTLGGVSTPSFQAVTDVGATTNHTITLTTPGTGDSMVFSPNTTGGTSRSGTFTSYDLSSNRTWKWPNQSGVPLMYPGPDAAFSTSNGMSFGVYTSVFGYLLGSFQVSQADSTVGSSILQVSSGAEAYIETTNNAGVTVTVRANSAKGIGLLSTGSQPSCTVSLRSNFWVTQAAGGVGDKVEACLKGTADTYAWRVIYQTP